MQIYTAEQIAEKTSGLTSPLGNIRAINAYYRAQDESDLYPVNGKFDATERAIRKARKLAQYSGGCYGLEYCYVLETILSEIVNDPRL